MRDITVEVTCDMTEVESVIEWVGSLPDDDPRLARMDQIPEGELWDHETVQGDTGVTIKLVKSAKLRRALSDG